jgi:AAHS family 4-hydroxybenzoate transporter-like MFS transporter
MKGVPVTHLFKDGRLVGTILMWALFFINLLDLYFIQNWLPTIFVDGGMVQKTAILMTTLAMVGGVFAAIVTGPLMDRLGPYVILTALFAGGAVAVASIGQAPTGALAALGVTTFFAGFFVAGAQKSANALAVVFYPTAIRSSGVGWALGIGRVGAIAGPMAAGWFLQQGWSRGNLFLAAAAPLVIAAVAAFVMEQIYGRRAKKAAAAAPQAVVDAPV